MANTTALINKAMREDKKISRLIESGKLKECKYEKPKDFFKQISIK